MENPPSQPMDSRLPREFRRTSKCGGTDPLADHQFRQVDDRIVYQTLVCIHLARATALKPLTLRGQLRRTLRNITPSFKRAPLLTTLTGELNDEVPYDKTGQSHQGLIQSLHKRFWSHTHAPHPSADPA